MNKEEIVMVDPLRAEKEGDPLYPEKKNAPSDDPEMESIIRIENEPLYGTAVASGNSGGRGQVAGHEYTGSGTAVKSGSEATGPQEPQGPAVTASTSDSWGDDGLAEKIASGTAGHDRAAQTYKDMIERLNSPETKEERLKRERREKSRSVIKSLSDGLGALSSLYYTTRYAPETYEASRGQKGAYEKALERARAERDRNDQAYFNLALRMADNDKDRAKTVREIEEQAEKLKMAREKHGWEAEKHEHDKTMWPDEERGLKADADTKENKKAMSDLELANKPTEIKNKNDYEENKAVTERERGRTERSRQGYYSSGAKKNLAQALEAKVRTKHIGEDKYITVTDPSGQEVRIYDNELDDLYQNASPETRARYNQEDSFNDTKTPTKEQLRQVAADHVRANGKTKKGKGAAYGTSKKKAY